MTHRPNYLQQARIALQRAESSMNAYELETLENRQLLSDIHMLSVALNPDYFDIPEVIPDEFSDFPFDEAH